MTDPETARRHWKSARWLSAGILLAWFALTFGVSYFARALGTSSAGSPWGFWMAAQGAPMLYLVLVAIYAWGMNRLDERAGVVEPH